MAARSVLRPRLDLFLIAIAVLMPAMVSPARAQRPVTGRPVPELAAVDAAVLGYMDTSDVGGAIVGISRHDRIVYLRGFGWSDAARTVPMRENRVQRVASITKTFTAAVIIDLVRRGLLSLTDHAFALDQDEPGILQLDPFPSLYDARSADIDIDHLLHHTAGWDRDLAQDPTQHELDCQEAMELDHLPEAQELMRWTLGRPLQHDPGTVEAYSNVGYLALGLIAEQVSGMSLLEYVRTYLLTDELWFPSADILMGFTFEDELDPREPHYNFDGLRVNVFDPDGPLVPAPYGSWNHEMKDGYGRVVTGAVPLLHHADRFVLNGPERGSRIAGSHDTQAHGGAQPGNNSYLIQMSGGTDVVVLVNEWDGETTHAAGIASDVLAALAQFQFPWIAETVESSWLEPGFTGEKHGSYDLPFSELGDLNAVGDWTSIKVKAGSSGWTGVVGGAHVLIDAAEGATAVFGK